MKYFVDRKSIVSLIYSQIIKYLFEKKLDYEIIDLTGWNDMNSVVNLVSQDTAILFSGEYLVKNISNHIDEFISQYSKRSKHIIFLGEWEMIHPRRLYIIQKLDDACSMHGVECDILSPWNSPNEINFKSIKMIRHDWIISQINFANSFDIEIENSQRDFFTCFQPKPNRQDRYEIKSILEKRNLGKNNLIYTDKTWFYDFSDQYQSTVCFNHLYDVTKIELVVETNTTENVFYATEKIYQPIAGGHPFVVISSPYFLHNLRKMGFKTFSPIIDESYDQEQDWDQRVSKIMDVLSNLKTFQKDQVRDICLHNQNLFYRLRATCLLDFNKKLSKILKRYQL